MSDIDNPQIIYRGQLYRRIAVKPYSRGDARTTRLAAWESGCAECGEVFDVVTTARVRNLRGPNRPIEPFYSSPEWRADRARADAPYPVCEVEDGAHLVRPNVPPAAHLAEASAVDVAKSTTTSGDWVSRKKLRTGNFTGSAVCRRIFRI
jgi:hypothetical protein